MTSPYYGCDMNQGHRLALAYRIPAHSGDRLTTLWVRLGGLGVPEVLGTLSELSRKVVGWRQRRVDEQAIRLIVDRALAGDGEAFAALFREYKRDVYRICRRMLGQAESADDAVSEVFLRARRALEGFDSEQPFRPWLIAIAGHHCIDQLRRKSLESRIFSEAELEESRVESIAPSALVRMLAMEESQSLERAIEALPIRYRLPLLLRYFEDMDYEAIAKSIGVTKNQVGTLLFRGKALLRTEVESLAGQHSKGTRRSRPGRKTARARLGRTKE